MPPDYNGKLKATSLSIVIKRSHIHLVQVA